MSHYSLGPFQFYTLKILYSTLCSPVACTPRNAIRHVTSDFDVCENWPRYANELSKRSAVSYVCVSTFQTEHVSCFQFLPLLEASICVKGISKTDHRDLSPGRTRQQHADWMKRLVYFWSSFCFVFLWIGCAGNHRRFLRSLFGALPWRIADYYEILVTGWWVGWYDLLFECWHLTSSKPQTLYPGKRQVRFAGHAAHHFLLEEDWRKWSSMTHKQRI